MPSTGSLRILQNLGIGNKCFNLCNIVLVFFVCGHYSYCRYEKLYKKRILDSPVLQINAENLKH